MKDLFVETGNFSAKFVSSEIDTPNSLDDRHDYYEIAYFVKANMQIFIDSSKYEINDGDLYFINPNIIHHIFYNKTCHYTRYVVHFKKDFIFDLLKTMNLETLFYGLENLSQEKVSIPLKSRDNFETLFSLLMKSEGSYKTQACQLNLMLILIRCHKELVITRTESDGSKKQALITQIVKYIDAHYSDDIDLSVLENEFSFSKYYICHAFKDITGFSVIEYIRYKRVVEAQKLIRQSEKDILDICYECGFNNLQNFYKAFKQLLGTTPGKFRGRVCGVRKN